MKLSIMEYMTYLNGSEHSKCVVEGENVLNAGHLVLAGKMGQHDNKISVYGLCIQSSALNENPHEIKGELSINNDVLKIEKMNCSCKAGNSGRCKHISAFLVKCIRDDIECLEEVSQTDIKCVWATEKRISKEKYKPVPVSEMPCFQDKIPTCDLVVDSEFILNFFCEGLTDSAVAKHRHGRRQISAIIQQTPIPTRTINSSFQEILDNACQSVTMMELFSVEIECKRPCCDTFLSNLNSDDIDVAVNIPQKSLEWDNLRKYRITGSRCYEIYTYSKNEWDTKALKYFFPLKLNNKFINHGIQYEAAAREAYVGFTGLTVVDCGFIIPHSNQWLGYSPDGIIYEDDKPTGLLEIKCIFEGKTTNIFDAVKKRPFVYKEDGIYKLKKKHKYYGQIQCGMAMLNFNKTAFVVYASFDNSIIIVNVEFDYKFAKEMLSVVKQKYVNNMIHVLCEKQLNR